MDTSTAPEIDGVSPPSIVPENPGTRPLTVTSPSFLTSNSSADQTGSIDHVPLGMTVAEDSARMDMDISFASATIEYASNCSRKKR